MFEHLFASVGPVGAAVLVFPILAVVFAVALSETLRVARPSGPESARSPSQALLELTHALGRGRWIARPSLARDIRPHHAATVGQSFTRFARLLGARVGAGAASQRVARRRAPEPQR